MREPLSIALISGCSPPGSCGIDDYTSKLAASLPADLLTVNHYRVGGVNDAIRFIKTFPPEKIFHFQYPTASWRTSITPILLVLISKLLRKKIFLTLHEYSRVHPLRRLMSLALITLVDVCLVTTEFEKHQLKSNWLVNKQIVTVPIGTNITPRRVVQGSTKNRVGLVFFGILAPKKGLEAFLRVVSSLSLEYPITVIGTVAKGYEAWAEDIQRTNPNVTFKLGLPDYKVSEELQNAQIAYLPFPVGISERSGTALAAIAHGLQLVTTEGTATLEAHKKISHIARDEATAAVIIESLIENKLGFKNPALYTNYLRERRWSFIALKHNEIYQNENV